MIVDNPTYYGDEMLCTECPFEAMQFGRLCAEIEGCPTEENYKHCCERAIVYAEEIA